MAEIETLLRAETHTAELHRIELYLLRQEARVSQASYLAKLQELKSEIKSFRSGRSTLSLEQLEIRLDQQFDLEQQKLRLESQMKRENFEIEAAEKRLKGSLWLVNILKVARRKEEEILKVV